MEFGVYYRKISDVTAKLPDLLSVKCDTGSGIGYDEFADVYTILFSGGSCAMDTANAPLKNWTAPFCTDSTKKSPMA